MDRLQTHIRTRAKRFESFEQAHEWVYEQKMMFDAVKSTSIKYNPDAVVFKYDAEITGWVTWL